VQDVINALKILVRSCPDVELILLGEGHEKLRLLDLVVLSELQGKVHFLGQVKNPYKYIAKSDLLVSASESEGFGNVLVEAFVCGTAVVSSDCIGGPRNILDPQSSNDDIKAGTVDYVEYGVLVPVGDCESLAAAINELLADPEKLRSYSEKGIRRARDFDKTLIAHKYTKQIQLLIDTDAKL
jgi:N-acetylgalactosamine-N,N'-diacetylbacillosaminyl-diphospho-undecaprenol 4-alpha-N-acetylgalactosaminyltransferase